MSERATKALRSVRVSGMKSNEQIDVVRVELDSHADTTVIGSSTALVIHDYERPVRVLGYDSSLGEKEPCKIVSAVVALDMEDGRTYMIVLNQSILIDRMETILLSTFQARDHGVRINDVPKCMVPNPTSSTHSVEISDLRIPLHLNGVISYFPVRKPTLNEWETCDLDMIIHMTSEEPEWDPNTDMFETREERLLDNPELLSEISAIHMSTLSANPEDLGAELTRQICVVRTDYDKASHLSGVSTGKREYKVDAETLAKRWNIPLRTAKRTLDATTQRGIRTVLHPTLSRRFRTNDRQLRYRRLTEDLYTDTLIVGKENQSWFRQNRYAQVFGSRNGWSRVYPMKVKSDAHEGLSKLFQREGVPPVMIADNSKEQTQGEFRRKLKEADCRLKQIEPYSQWQNAAEGTIREVKKGSTRKMMSKQSPSSLWDHCLELESMIRSNTALDIYSLEGQVPETIMSGQTSDISPFVEAGWYDFVYAWDQSAFPEPKEILVRWLGPAVDVGPALTAKMLKPNGQILYTSTWRPLTDEEWKSADHAKARDEYDERIKSKLGESALIKIKSESGTGSADDEDETPSFPLYQDDFEGEYHHEPDIDDLTPDVNDEYLGVEVNLPLAGELKSATVKKRTVDGEGNPSGEANENALLDTRHYLVEFVDGRTATYAANVIAESMAAMCDPEGNEHMIFEGIIDHRKTDDAVPYDDRFVMIGGRRHKRVTTKGWELCIKWKNGTTTWERLSDVKESFPVEVAEYAISRDISKEAAFHWWVPYVLKKRDRIIKAVNKRYLKRTHKYGIELPKTFKEAVDLDKRNGNTLWQDAIRKEMDAVRIAFEVIPDDAEIKPGYQQLKCHLVFDIKLDGFKRKARYVAQGCSVITPPMMTYSSVVSRETVRIAMTAAALNGLEVKASDIMNAYLTAPCDEKIWTILGPEFGPMHAGKRAYVVRALYGLNSAGASFSRHLATCMRHLGYSRCDADPDLWMREAKWPDTGDRYYQYVLLYVDDALAIGHDATKMLKELDHYFMMKPGSIGDPDIYLGAKARLIQLPNGVRAWSMCPSKYVQEAVANVHKYLKENEPARTLKKRKSPWPSDYEIELDDTEYLSSERANYYQSQVGVLNWMLELGRVDIITETSKLASQMAAPREGHMDALMHLMGYLWNHHNSRHVFDPTYPDLDHGTFLDCDWKGFYDDAKEKLPVRYPKPLGKDFDIVFWVDSDHASDKLKRRSRTGFFYFLNSALIGWKSKAQSTIERSVFGAEFCAMTLAMETNRALRFKLRMMGIPVNGPSYFYGDNMSVIHNTQKPESVLKKKSNSVCYHAVRESVAMGEMVTSHVKSQDNLGDLATKVGHPRSLREKLVSRLIDFVYTGPDL